MRRWHAIRALLAMVLLVSCTSPSTSGRTSVPGASVPVPSMHVGDDAPTGASDPVAGLLTALQDRAITPQVVGDSQIDWLRSAPGVAYTLGPTIDQERLYLHVYPTVEAALATAASILPSADTGATDWIDVPHFFQCEQLIALYLGRDPHVTGALTERCGPQFAGQ